MCDLLAGNRLFLIVTKTLERFPEVFEQRHPVFVSKRNLIEVVFKLGSEVVIDILGEMVRQKPVNDAADVGRVESFALDLDVLAILQRHDNACIGRRSADAVLFERFNKARFGESRRWLREMLFGPQHIKADRVTFLNVGQQAITIIVLVAVVLTFLIDGHETRLDKDRAVRPQAVAIFFGACCKLDCHGVEYGRYHLASHRALPDQ